MVNPDTFEAVALEHLAVLYRVARRLTKSADAAEDLVGSTLVRAAGGWASFDGRFAKSWLIRIMNNAYLKEASVLSR